MRCLIVIVAVLALCPACSSIDDARADGVSIALSDDRLEAQDLNHEVTRAHGAPSGPGGLLRGIAVVFSRVGADGIHVADIEFTDDATPADLDRLAARIDAAGLEAVWLDAGDPWPFCVGEPDCPFVGERLG